MRAFTAALLLLAVAHSSLAMASPTMAPSPVVAAPAAHPVAPQRLRVDVVNVYPHDPGAFTQGLLLHDGALLESTGLEGRSSLREVELPTGHVARRLDLSPTYFGEGLALVGNRLIQLTWKNRVAFVYDLASFKQLGQLSYDGDGWGLCFDGQRLVRSDGTDRLYFHDPQTLARLGSVAVTLNGQPLRQLNELECVEGVVYANVWTTDSIVRIDPRTGIVTGVVDAAGLLTPAERSRADILNGIAWDPAKGTFYITGKLWPKLFEVRFVPADH